MLFWFFLSLNLYGYDTVHRYFLIVYGKTTFIFVRFVGYRSDKSADGRRQFPSLLTSLRDD